MHQAIMINVWKRSFQNIHRTFLFIYRNSPKWTLLHLFTSLVMGVIPLALIYLIKLLIDEVSLALSDGSPENYDLIFWIILATGIVFFLNSAIGTIMNFIKDKHVRKIDDMMYEKVQNKAASLDLEYYEDPHYHDIIFRAKRESQYRPQQIITGIIQVVQNAISLIIAAVLLTYFNYLIILALILATIPGILVKFRFNELDYKLVKKHTPDIRKNFYFNRILTEKPFAKELRLFGLASYFRKQFVTLRAKFWKSKENLLRQKMIFEVLSHLIAAAAIFGAFAYMTRQAVQGEVTIGDLILFLLVIRRGFTFLKGVLDGISNLYEQNLFLHNLFEFLNLPQKITYPASTGVSSVSPVEIMIENVSFAYPNNQRPVLEKINMKIPAGKTIAIVGDNGAGKTTLTKLISRFYDPDKGNIYVNGINLKEWNLHDLYKHISVMFQDFILYNLTAGENIWFGDIHKPHEATQLKKAAEMAGVKEKIEALPKGFHTHIGNLFDDSIELSAGEWQRLAIARAYFRNAGLYILDEPTSSMDPQTEESIFNKFRELVRNKTAILISHRFTTIQMADYIYVIGEKNIVEHGTHQELIDKGGKYATMFHAQAKHYQ